MKLSTQRSLLVLVSLVISAFIAGGAIVGFKLNGDYQAKLKDNVFLEKRLSILRQSTKKEKTPHSRLKSVRVEKAMHKKLGATRYFSGRLVEIQRSVLASETNGPVVSLPVEVGMPVRKNETVIAEIDTIWTKLAAEQAQRQITVSRVQLGFQRREYERLQQLSGQGAGYVSASDLDSQQLKMEELQANIALQQVVLTEAEKRVARSKIVAPFNGVIVKKISEVGSYVSPGSPLVEIVSTGKIDAEIQVSETFIDRLKVGQDVPIWIDSLDLEVTGKIHSIVPLGSTAARSSPILIRLDDRSGSLKVGMSVRARLQITDARESIVVSKDAVLDRPDGALVWIAVPRQKDKNSPSSAELFAQPVQVVITARTDTLYAVVPIAEEGRKLLVPGVDCVVEGADRLVVNEPISLTEIEPSFFKNLPQASGHTIIRPIEETSFFNPKTNRVEEIDNNGSD